MFEIYKAINKQLNEALDTAFAQEALAAKEAGESLDPQLMPASKPEFGDFKVNGALTLARKIKQPPRHIAETIIRQLEKSSRFNDCFFWAHSADCGTITFRYRSRI